MSSKPSLVFVPGAWHLPEYWNKVVENLPDYHCSTPALPTATSNRKANFKDDITAVQDAIRAETTKGRDVVIISHSYGGMVANSAIKGFARPKDSAKTDSGYIVGNIVMASGFTQSGMTFLEMVGGRPPPIWKINEDTGLADLTVPPRELFYNDLSEEEGEYWVSKLQPHSLDAFRTHAELTYTGWMDVPNVYVLTTNDKTHPIEVQEMIVKMATDAGAEVECRRISASHSPMLSKPKETAEIIEEAVAVFTAR
jgi:pimeloyl-ACP methyl ester carboxylesterase